MHPVQHADATRHPPRAAQRPTATPTGAPTGAPTRITSADLLRGARELEIEHGGALYRLRLTALGKLILTK